MSWRFKGLLFDQLDTKIWRLENMLDNVKYIFNIFQIKEGREEVAASERKM